MRIGTLSCWLFGHKFLGRREWINHEDNDSLWTTQVKTDFCVRCGIKEANHKTK